jgi:OFA family oxalate/formate antiporter-like MFS transporter
MKVSFTMIIASLGLFAVLFAVKIISTFIGVYFLVRKYNPTGGSFATMPAFAADSFRPAYIGRVYGIMLTAWGAAGVVGPLVFAQVKGAALYVAAALLIVGFILAISYKMLQLKKV